MGDQSAAFFDFDKTLLHGDAGIIFGRSLIVSSLNDARHEPDPVERRRKFKELGGRLGQALAAEAVLRGLYSAKLLKRSQLVRRAYRGLAGLPAREMEARMHDVFHELVAPRLYPGMAEIMEKHRQFGHRLAIITTGPSILIQHCREYLGHDIDVIGCDLLEEDGKWTGEVDGPLYGGDKRNSVEDYANAHGVDLKTSYAYTDHWSDVFFLEAVGHPVVVNPKWRLERLARDRGWGILQVRPPRTLADTVARMVHPERKH